MKKKLLRVKIIKCGFQTYWYRRHIGESFWVREMSQDNRVYEVFLLNDIKTSVPYMIDIADTKKLKAREKSTVRSSKPRTTKVCSH